MYFSFRLDIGVRNFKDIKARFDLYGTSIASWIVENVCNIVLFLVATDWFSPIIASNFFAYDSWGL